MFRNWWIGAVVAGLVSPAFVRAAEPNVKPWIEKPNVAAAEGQGDVLAELGEYWVGLICSQAGPALSAQLGLPENQGLVVEDTAPDSPAAKAGFQKHDVLLKANDKPLESVKDLLDTINKVKEGKLTVQLLRGGKQQTITVTPAKRPENARLPGMPGKMGSEAIGKWLEQMVPGEEGRNFQFRIIRPGAIFPPGTPLAPPTKLPGNMSITVTREGDKPAQITVKEGEQKWEVSEKDLGKLPEKVRPYVEQMLGRGPIGFRTFNLPVPAPSTGGVQPGHVPGAEYHPFVPGDMEKQLQDMNRQIEQLRKAVDDLRGKPGHKPEKRHAPKEKVEKKLEAAPDAERT
jgi:hypothetical protein